MAVPSGYIGRLSEFQQSRETFSAYIEHLERFFAVNNITEVEASDAESRHLNEATPESNKRAIFLTEIGPGVYDTVKNLLAPAKPKDTSLKDILKKLTEHYDSKLLV